MNSKPTTVETHHAAPLPSPVRVQTKNTSKSNSLISSLIEASTSADTSYSMSEISSDRSFSTPAGRRHAHTVARKTKEKSTKILVFLSMLIVLLQMLQFFEIHRFKNFVFPNSPIVSSSAPEVSRSLPFFNQFNIFEIHRGDKNHPHRKTNDSSRSRSLSIEKSKTFPGATSSYSAFFTPKIKTDVSPKQKTINLVGLVSKIKSLKPVKIVRNILKENKTISSASSRIISWIESLPRPLKKAGSLLKKAISMNIPAPLVLGLMVIGQAMNPSYYFYKIHTSKLEHVIRFMC